ncbi:hypothetical protein BUALT_Bualt08G0065400 [Buddleja alternifolia]|uniref:Ubiquitin-like domain-containing protein n=1 Tax=Buddleja alternifolia TaxID=168488 RepID=A0AAV6XC95_9LAMI|nr:hypothetical protein BUALT_Bualt08G0065400 [Buddleja alternifolia]
MKVVAEILTGSLFYVNIEEDANVGELKKQIGSNQENLPTNRLILMLDADQQRFLLVKDEVSLKEYGVQDGSHIYIFFEPLDHGSAINSSLNSQVSISNKHSEERSPPVDPSC